MRRALLAALALGAKGLAAQAPACAPEAMARDTVRYALIVQARLGRDSLPDATASAIAGEAILGAGFRVPATIASAFPTGAQPRQFTPRDEITLSRVVAYPSTGAGIATVRQPPRRLAEPITDSVFRLATERADVHPILPHRDGSDTMPVTLELVAVRTPQVGFTVARLGLAQLLYDTPPEWQDPPRPRFPDALRRDGVEGAVRLRFIVGADGRVDTSTVDVRSASHPAFVAPAVEALAAARFRPAKAGACPVATIVETGVRFTFRSSTRVLRETVTGTGVRRP
ncbi:MAG TPA: TonB family protein [Gemmatimonadales bacterium]|nr:TonB family protein [Gemmatimonadales bacterium]